MKRAVTRNMCFFYLALNTSIPIDYHQLSIFNNYSPKWRWLVVDIYRAAKQRGKYPTLATTTTPFFPSCSEVNSAGYSEFDKPISVRV